MPPPHVTEITLPYVSITGLQLKSPFLAPAFWWHAVAELFGLQTLDARDVGEIVPSLAAVSGRDMT